jgi:excisionase family DNA binding protein
LETEEALEARQGAQQASGTPAEYLTAQDVATLLRVDDKTVLRWSLEDATMPVLKRGRLVRFPKARLLAWLRAKERPTARVAHAVAQTAVSSTPA